MLDKLIVDRDPTALRGQMSSSKVNAESTRGVQGGCGVLEAKVLLIFVMRTGWPSNDNPRSLFSSSLSFSPKLPSPIQERS